MAARNDVVEPFCRCTLAAAAVGDRTSKHGRGFTVDEAFVRHAIAAAVGGAAVGAGIVVGSDGERCRGDGERTVDVGDGVSDQRGKRGGVRARRRAYHQPHLNRIGADTRLGTDLIVVERPLEHARVAAIDGGVQLQLLFDPFAGQETFDPHTRHARVAQTLAVVGLRYVERGDGERQAIQIQPAVDIVDGVIGRDEPAGHNGEATYGRIHRAGHPAIGTPAQAKGERAAQISRRFAVHQSGDGGGVLVERMAVVVARLVIGPDGERRTGGGERARYEGDIVFDGRQAAGRDRVAARIHRALAVAAVGECATEDAGCIFVVAIHEALVGDAIAAAPGRAVVNARHIFGPHGEGTVGDGENAVLELHRVVGRRQARRRDDVTGADGCCTLAASAIGERALQHRGILTIDEAEILHAIAARVGVAVVRFAGVVGADHQRRRRDAAGHGRRVDVHLIVVPAIAVLDHELRRNAQGVTADTRCVVLLRKVGDGVAPGHRTADDGRRLTAVHRAVVGLAGRHRAQRDGAFVDGHWAADVGDLVICSGKPARRNAVAADMARTHAAAAEAERALQHRGIFAADEAGDLHVAGGGREGGVVIGPVHR